VIPALALALCWCALTMVASIIAYSLSGSSAKVLKSLSQTPLAAQREKRLWMFFESPKRCGKSRHGAPERNFQITASTNRRLPSSLLRPTVAGRRRAVRASYGSASQAREASAGLVLNDGNLIVLYVITEGEGTADPQALSFRGSNFVADALRSDLPLELGEGQKHVERQPAHRSRGVELLGDRDERRDCRNRARTIPKHPRAAPQARPVISSTTSRGKPTARMQCPVCYAPAFGHLPPKRSEVAGLKHQHRIACDSALTIAASHAPCPTRGRMTGPVVLKIFWQPSNTALPRSANCILRNEFRVNLDEAWYSNPPRC
jgi:hypothetical protein